jgi:uncharacterized protein
MKFDSDPIIWQRLDVPGHDTAAVYRSGEGWQLSGVAVLAESGRPCRVEYEIACDARWLTQQCSLRGYIGTTPVALDIARNADGAWTVDDVAAPHLDGCDDIDLGFTPATNLLPIRRLALGVGESAPVRAAWVRFPALTTEVLEQVYTRRGDDRYLYTSAGGAFRRELVVDDRGFVLDYPGLWRAEARA